MDNGSIASVLNKIQLDIIEYMEKNDITEKSDFEAWDLLMSNFLNLETALIRCENYENSILRICEN